MELVLAKGFQIYMLVLMPFLFIVHFYLKRDYAGWSTFLLLYKFSMLVSMVIIFIILDYQMKRRHHFEYQRISNPFC